MKVLIKDIETILIAVVCVVGNLVLFWKLCFRKHPKIIVYLIIVGTAVVDVVKMISEIVVVICRRTDYVYLVEWWKYRIYLHHVCTYIAAWNIVLLCVVRFIILQNHPCMIRTRRYFPHELCVFLWLLISVCNIPLIVSHSSDHTRDIWLFYSFSYIVPCFVIVSLYMLSRLYRRTPTEYYSPGKRRFPSMVTVLAIMFVMYKLPNVVCVVVMLYATNADSSTFHEVYSYTLVVDLLDAALRPIVFFCGYKSTEYEASNREPFTGIELPVPNPLPPTTASQTSDRESFIGMELSALNPLPQTRSEGSNFR